MKHWVITLIMLMVFCGDAKAQNKKPVRVTSNKTAAGSAASVVRGKDVYTQLCLACHQEDGSGVPRLNPPLTPNDWVAGPKQRLINLVLNGSQGQVEIDGDTWSNSMPAQAHLTDQQIADVLTYVRSNFGNAASAVTAAEVKAQRGKK